MRNIITFIVTFLVSTTLFSQVKNVYTVSFDNVSHHEAQITASFSNLQPGNVVIKIAKKSPGSYGSFQFAKNIYNFEITNGSGKTLKYTQSSLGEWVVNNHSGEINVKYTLFGDAKDGIFSQFSEDQVIINNPSAFVYIPKLSGRPVELNINSRNDLNWKIATQLRKAKVIAKAQQNENIYEATNLNDFMDSPIFMANFTVAEKIMEANGKQFTLKVALYGSESYADELLDKVSKTIEEQYLIFGSYPNFDNDQYYFMMSFQPYNENNAIEHKNSSLLLSTKEIARTGTINIVESMTTLFVKSWNKTRIRPITLMPFDLQEDVLTSEYWFAEGFSKYYALLSMVRSRIIIEDKYLEKLSYYVNQAIKSSALKYNNTLEMSKRSDYYANHKKDKSAQNADNLYIPYEYHGFVIALLLDIELRQEDGLSLDGYMSLMWSKYGKTENGYTIENLYATLLEYAGDSFAKKFFKNNIYESTDFDFQKLMTSVGVNASHIETPYLGADIEFNTEDLAEIVSYTIPDSPAYIGGLEKGDIITSIDNTSFSNSTQLENTINKIKVGKKIGIKFSRNGEEKSTILKLKSNPNIKFSSIIKISSKVADSKRAWIGE